MNNDPYEYDEFPGVLKNKFDEKNKDSLKILESELTKNKLCTSSTIKGNYDFKHFKALHKHIFGDIYEWAGEERTKNLYKAERVLNGMCAEYSDYSQIKNDVESPLKKLREINWQELTIDEKAKNLTEITAELWRTHPFREGNTRVTLEFITNFAEENDFPLNKKIFEENNIYTRESLVMASLKEKPERKYLEKILKDSLERGQLEKE